jgi:hypothetical protein
MFMADEDGIDLGDLVAQELGLGIRAAVHKQGGFSGKEQGGPFPFLPTASHVAADQAVTMDLRHPPCTAGSQEDNVHYPVPFLSQLFFRFSTVSDGNTRIAHGPLQQMTHDPRPGFS